MIFNLPDFSLEFESHLSDLNSGLSPDSPNQKNEECKWAYNYPAKSRFLPFLNFKVQFPTNSLLNFCPSFERFVEGSGVLGLPSLDSAAPKSSDEVKICGSGLDFAFRLQSLLQSSTSLGMMTLS
jgi:hypothetical protein